MADVVVGVDLGTGGVRAIARFVPSTLKVSNQRLGDKEKTATSEVASLYPHYNC
jgi:hypothetical protein